MKYLIQLLFLSLLLSSCNIFDPNMFEPKMIVDPVVDANDGKSYQSSAFDTFSDINRQTSKIMSQKYFSGTYLKRDEIDKIEIGDWGEDTHYKIWAPSTLFFDYNNDDKVDLLSYLVDFTPLNYGSELGIHPGKFVLIDDYFSDSSKVTYHDAPFSTLGEFELGNFDSDSELEILTHPGDGHVRNDGTHDFNGSRMVILNVNESGEITWNDFGHETWSHQYTSGDVDNDGDLDILYHVYDATPIENHNHRYGLFQILENDGNGYFTEKNPWQTFIGLRDSLFRKEDRFIDTTMYSFNMLTAELFDLDNDGILDIITGWNHDSCSDDENRGTPLCDNKTKILWGNGDGTFDMNRMTSLPNEYKNLIKNDTYTDIHTFSPMNHSFVDYDFDGDVDIISVIIKDNQKGGGYDGWYVQLHENFGNRKFSDVTDDLFMTYTNANNDEGFQFCNDFDFEDLYDIVPYDIDNDGDYDLIPNKVPNWSMTCKLEKNTYYENVNGKFYLRNP